ncbi:MAG: heme exporter protein CcmD [Oleiphilaceae bacterium]|nr:heme exporter protein CcmD [Oleiphilaceae bacterium]
MAFDSFGALLWMEGHGPYVWVCYGVFFVFIGGLAIWSRRQRRQLVERHRRQWHMPGHQQNPAMENTGDFAPINQSRT